jgi:ribosomal protein L11 methylase PrmA
MACHEAVANVRLNGLAQNVHIVTGGLEALKATGFNIVMANLRPPTLSRLMPEMMTRTLNGGYWILSGFRPEEMDPLKEKLSHGFQIIWTENDRNWSVFAAQRK